MLYTSLMFHEQLKPHIPDWTVVSNCKILHSMLLQNDPEQMDILAEMHINLLDSKWTLNGKRRVTVDIEWSE